MLYVFINRYPDDMLGNGQIQHEYYRVFNFYFLNLKSKKLMSIITKKYNKK